MFTVHYNNKTYNAKLISPGYASNGHPAFQLVNQDDPSDNEYDHIVSVNVNNALPKELICIKNWSEYAGIEQPLIDAGIIEEFPLTVIPSGFVRIPVYQLTDEAAATL